MDGFYSCFIKAQNTTFDKALERYEAPFRVSKDSIIHDIEKTTKDILDAIKLFGYESIENVTLKELENRRRELIAPNNILDINFACTVNESYSMLRETILQFKKQRL